MDIAALSMGISQADVINNVETAVLAKSLDTMKESGAGLIDMMNRSAMERSVNPELGANIDITIYNCFLKINPHLCCEYFHYTDGVVFYSFLLYY